MADSKCLSYKCRYAISFNLAILLFCLAGGLFVSGAITYSSDRYAKTIHEQNTCEVIASNYYQTRCSGYRSTYVCYRPIWLVTYSLVQDSNETLIDATIEHDGFRRSAAAENKQNQYQVSTVTKFEKKKKNLFIVLILSKTIKTL